MVNWDGNLKKWRLFEDECLYLNPPEHSLKIIKNNFYEKVIESPNWLPVGYIPTPKTKMEWFFYHFIHGLWMKYPVWKVVLYCLDKDNYPVYERK